MSWSLPNRWTPVAGRTTIGRAQQIAPRIPNVGQCDRLQSNSLRYVCRIQIHLFHSSSTNPKTLNNSLNSQKSTPSSVPATQNRDSRERIGQDEAPDDIERFCLCCRIQQKILCELVDRHAGKRERNQLQAALVRSKEFVQTMRTGPRRVQSCDRETILRKRHLQKKNYQSYQLPKPNSMRNGIVMYGRLSWGGPEIIIPTLTLNSNMPRSEITFVRN
jgi:hypothetical protein